MALRASLLLASIVSALSLHISTDFNDGDVVFPKPEGSILPQHCFHFNAACRAEAESRFEDAFRIYESKYEECGSHGWNVTGGASGSLSFVIFKTTPCGLRVSLKLLEDPKECNILKLMTSKESQVACPGCFPTYYYYSNTTRACYSEHVYPSQRFEHVLPIRQDALTPDRLRAIKGTFLQGLAAIRLLRSHNWEHGDLGLRNMLLRRTTLPDGQAGYHLVMIDLGSALPANRVVPLEEFEAAEAAELMLREKAQKERKRNQYRTKPADHLHHDRLVLERGGRRLGNGPHTDVYTLAKEYQTGSSRNPVGSSAWALRAVFREIMAANDRRQKPDYAAITRAIRDFQLIE